MQPHIYQHRVQQTLLSCAFINLCSRVVCVCVSVIDMRSEAIGTNNADFYSGYAMKNLMGSVCVLHVREVWECVWEQKGGNRCAWLSWPIVITLCALEAAGWLHFSLSLSYFKLLVFQLDFPHAKALFMYIYRKYRLVFFHVKQKGQKCLLSICTENK